MRTTDKENYVEVELETPSGQHAFTTAQRAQDNRFWNRDPETCELGKFMQDNGKHTQVIVKCGDGYTKIR
jgi:hypothetical protein